MELLRFVLYMRERERERERERDAIGLYVYINIGMHRCPSRVTTTPADWSVSASAMPSRGSVCNHLWSS